MSTLTISYQCLSCRLRNALGRASRRGFHASPSAQARRNKRAVSVKASDMESRPYRPYTDRERRLLAIKYTPEQMKVIDAGEQAVDPEDMARGRMRDDPTRIKYLDDFATSRPLLDRDPNAREYNTAEIERAQVEDSLAQTDPHMLRLCQQTGLTKEQIGKLRIKNLVSHRVVNQTRMGKIQSQYFLTIAGNGDGMVGIGEGKAAEDEDGRRQAMMNAVRNMKPIPRYEGRTIYGEVNGKVGASVVQLSSRPPGFGNRCQHLIFELTRAAGISDLSARTPRSRNKMNVVKAAFEALRSQRLPDDVARGLGRKLVDVRKVYYGGLVH